MFKTPKQLCCKLLYCTDHSWQCVDNIWRLFTSSY